jgi:hypothetical protein
MQRLIPASEKYQEIFDRYRSPLKSVIKYIVMFKNIRTGKTEAFRNIHSYITLIHYRDEIDMVVNSQINSQMVLGGFASDAKNREGLRAIFFTIFEPFKTPFDDLVFPLLSKKISCATLMTQDFLRATSNF